MNSDKRRVSYGGEIIEYTLLRKNVKNINLRIHTDGGVRVSAGSFVPLKAVDAFVLSNAPKILAVRGSAQVMSDAQPLPRTFETGEVYTVLGRDRTLEVRRGARASVCMEDDIILLTVKSADSSKEKERVLRKYFKDMCRQIFGEYMGLWYRDFADICGEMPLLRIRRMKSCWGTCLVKKNTITLNSSLIMAPSQCISYVVLHEFCHFVHPNHSKEFYGLVGRHMPGWKACRKALREKTRFCHLID